MKKYFYPLVGLLILLSIVFLFRKINNIFNIDESLISQKIIKFNIDSFEKIKFKLDIK